MVEVCVNEWAALSGLLDQALELPPGDRAPWIENLPHEHDAIRPRLHRLLLGTGSDAASLFLKTIPKLDAENIDAVPDIDDDLPRPDSVANYRIVRKLSEGGMGTVWLAHRTDVMVNRAVALKLPRGAWLGAGLAERMAEEREILAALDHPNIARLYDAGVAGAGQPYLALEYVDGNPIDEYVKARQPAIRARLQLFLQMTRAVAHAHARLVVHRDLKPSNILVTDHGEVKLLDFGIAKLLDDGRAVEGEPGGRLLTPDYASPEQIAGGALGIATDVYSSGVVLYEVLTGVRPFSRTRSSRRSPEESAAETRPRRPSDAAADPSTRRVLRGDLDAIVLKALETRPDRRYATIDALADDIERYLHHHPVLARPDAIWYRLSKCIVRHRVACAAAAAVLVAMLAGTGVATWQAHVALTEKAAALEVRDFLITLFQDASPYNTGGRALSALEWLKRVRTRIDRGLSERPALRVQLLNVVGASLLTLQDTSAAEEVLVRAVQDGMSRLGPLSPETLRARVLMLGVHRFRGRTKEMRAELEQLLPVLRSKNKLLAEDLVVALKNQAHLEIDEGRYEAAEAAALEALDVARRSLGRDHPETVAAVLMRALTYQHSRAPDEALEASELAYHTALSVFNDAPTHPRTIEGRHLYGRALAEVGETARGIEQLGGAVADAAEVFGPTSRMVGVFSLSLAKLQSEAGQVAEALETSTRAVDIIAGHTTPQAFRFANALHQRGVALLAARRPGEALPDLARAAGIVRQTMPAEHLVTRRFEADRALALAQSGNHLQAREMLAARLPKPGSPPDESERFALYSMGVATRLAGDSSHALGFQRQVLQSAIKGRSDELLHMKAAIEMGLAMLDLSSPHEASASFEQALAVSRKLQTDAAPDRTDILVGLARARAAAARRPYLEPAGE
jgi:serine/threonine-protein kinase